MFDLGRDKKKAGGDYSFDLENELKNEPGKLRAYQEHIQERINQIKNALRQGEDKKNFDQMQILLHGYLAMQKVFQRVNRKSF